MTLTLEIVAPQTADRPRQTFTEKGGTIGRAPRNTWVLQHKEVSSQHALVSFHDGVFYIEDTSTNGVFIKSPDNRLVKGHPYALKSGDRLLIQPYAISVNIEAREEIAAAPLARLDRDDPFAGLDLGGVPVPEPVVSESVDPLDFFPPLPPAPGSSKRVPFNAEPNPLSEHYEPPRPIAPEPPPFSAKRQDTGGIPVGYDPLKDDPFSTAPSPIPSLPPTVETPPIAPPPVRPSESRSAAPPPPPPSPARPVVAWTPPEPVAPIVPAPVAAFEPEEPVDIEPVATSEAAVVESPAPPPPIAPQPPPARTAASAGELDLAQMLAGAGLSDVAVTPELMRTFGQILRVVVAGMMDVLQARQRIKEEFQMRMTTVRPADNNPLKFSANVEDALHNLLVKRNQAYMGPVDAFGDAFDDLRHHQLAMLAGMRVAFQSMLAQFDPDRLQEDFDRQIGSALALKPAAMRYWELYREKRKAMLADPESAFAHLFGEEFARAYDQQFRRLKAERRGPHDK